MASGRRGKPHGCEPRPRPSNVDGSTSRGVPASARLGYPGRLSFLVSHCLRSSIPPPLAPGGAAGPVEQLALQVAGAVDGLQVATVEQRDDLEGADLEL